MKYYSLLNFNKEPFSNSPDPEMFFKSSQHQGCVQKLELAIHMRRGLSVVIGDIGTGKSTICRQLLRQISNNEKILPHLILDPEFNSADEFLLTITKTLSLKDTENKSAWQIKDHIKNYLFEQAAKLDKIPVLVIDEGQKLPLFCIEILREFLNYETNRHKLLQIVIFAQEEFNDILKSQANFTDRITSRHHLAPLNFRDTRAMISFRLRKSHRLPDSPPRLFSPVAILMIYLISGGYPRKIVMLCSKLIIALLVKNKKRAGGLAVLGCLRETGKLAYGRMLKLAAVLLISVTAIGAIVNYTFKKEPVAIAKQPPVSAAMISPKTAAPTAAKSKKTTSQIPPVKKIKKQELPLVDFSLLPPLLGELPIEPGTTLSKMTARVYGRYTRARLKMVMRANRGLGPVRKLRPGDIIKFPRERKNSFQPQPTEFWLELTVKNNLASAYNIVKKYPEDAPPIIIVPTLRSAAKGERTPVFIIVVERIFAKKEAAETVLQEIPPALQKGGRIRQG